MSDCVLIGAFILGRCTIICRFWKISVNVLKNNNDSQLNIDFGFKTILFEKFSRSNTSQGEQ